DGPALAWRTGPTLLADKTMKEFIPYLQDHLARGGAPQWLQRPGSWLAIAAGLGLIIVLARMLMKRSRELQAAAPPVPQMPSPRRAPSVGVFGLWTDALASQIPESGKERKEFGAILKQAG